MRTLLKSFIGFVFVILISGCTATDIKTDDTADDKAVLPDLTVADYMIIGSADAPITFYEFSDYQCPFCKKFTMESLPLIKEKYIDTGKVRFVFKDFPLEIHGEARAGAVAARCAGVQGKYYAYHDVLFENSKDFSAVNFKLWAEELDLDVNEFLSCLDDPSQMAKVENDIMEAQLAGVKGTPSFLINGRLVRGAQPFAAFEMVIEEALNNSIVIETTAEATCLSDNDCKASRSFPPFCSQSNPNEVCVVTSAPTCKLPGTVESECVNIVTEECSPCEDGLSCSDGKCK